MARWTPAQGRGDGKGLKASGTDNGQSLGIARLPRRGGVLHPRAARAVQPGDEPARQPHGHHRHDHCGGDDAGDEDFDDEL